MCGTKWNNFFAKKVSGIVGMASRYVLRIIFILRDERGKDDLFFELNKIANPNHKVIL